jgi:hypothetical protein
MPIIESVISKTTRIHKTHFRENLRKKRCWQTQHIFRLIYFPPRIIGKYQIGGIIVHKHLFTQSYKLKLFLDSCCFTSSHIMLKEHCMIHVVVSFVSAGVTYLSRCGFQWFLYGQN